MEDLLSGLVDRLRTACGADLISVVLYGSAASHDYHEKHSDLNVLCVLKQVGLAELEKAGEALQWWMKRGQPAPLLLSSEELEDGCDVFPIEFIDIQDNYRVLHGADVVAGIQINTAQHRVQLEHELRSRLLRLRKRYLESRHDSKEVTALMLDSLPTFATLFRHALLLAGFPAPTRKHEIFHAVAEQFQVGPAPFESLLEIRRGSRKASPAEVHAWFESYLDGITRMSEVVDEL